MRNARFWVYINGGPVKLTLRPGQVLRHYVGWTHDEGWSSEMHEWEHDGDAVVRRWEMAGSDCDGPLTTYGEDSCDLVWLRAREPHSEPHEHANYIGVMWPEWQRGRREQRDVFAEAAGY